MECYDFELNISAYIDGEIKQAIYSDFINHKENCDNCSKKLVYITSLIKIMPKMSTINTSKNFINNLNNKLYEINNKQTRIYTRVFKSWKFELIPSLGMGVATILVFFSGYFLINQDTPPNIKNKNLFKKQQYTNQKQNSFFNPRGNNRSLAELDSSAQIEDDNEKLDRQKIHLVGGKK